ncbi:MAG TPA: hypothetical protein VF086_22070 [Propionibacteriaceae bacterium]
MSRHNSTDEDRCASPGCQRILTGNTVVIARDGKRYCKHHGDRLPKYLRRTPRVPRPLTPDEQTT